MTGGRVFDASLRALAPFGRLVTFGMASRVPPTPVAPAPLMATSRAVIGFWLMHALALPGGLRPAMDELLDLHAAGRLRALDGGRYPLESARQAHEDIASRRTHGKLVLDHHALALTTDHRPTDRHRPRGDDHVPEIDAAFTDLPLRQLADAALSRARELGAEHADIRVERIKDSHLSLHDARLDGSRGRRGRRLRGAGLHDGSWGFASHVDLTPESAERMAEQAVEVAKVSRPLSTQRVELADEPAYGDVTWVSPYEVDPFTRPGRRQGLAARRLERRAAGARHRRPRRRVGALACSRTSSTPTWPAPRRPSSGCASTAQLEAVGIDKESGRFDTMRTLAPPAGRGWEYAHRHRLRLGRRARRAARAPGREAAGARRSRAATTTWSSTRPTCSSPSTSRSATRPSWTGRWATRPTTPAPRSRPSTSSSTLQYGSEVMNVTGDRTAEHGLATIGWDDEGVAGQQWDIVKDGVLVGYQLDRRDGPAEEPRPVQRLRVRRLVRRTCRCSGWPTCRCSRPTDGPSTEELISRVDRGIYVVGDKSWSIDMQRYNFQFTGQRFFQIENGRLAGQLRDVAYQATTTDFWGSMEAVGGPQTYVLGGAFNCGKGQPGQVAAVSHGCPSTLFRGVRILNTQCGGRPMSTTTTSVTAQDVVERALELSTADGCVVLAEESSEANLRWAANTLTTNGVMRGRQLTVIATVGGSEGTATGVVSRSNVGLDQVEALVRAAEEAARAGAHRRGRPAADHARAGAAVRPGLGRARRPRPRSASSATLRLDPRRGRSSTPGPTAASCSASPSTSCTRRTSARSTGAAACGTPSRPAGSRSPARPPTGRARRGSGRAPATSPTST